MKLGEIDINEEDRDLIIYAYNSDSPATIGYLSERAAADFYVKQGYSINATPALNDFGVDFIADRNDEHIGVIVKSVALQHFSSFARIMLRKQMPRLQDSLKRNNLIKCHVVILVRGGDELIREERIFPNLAVMFGELDIELNLRSDALARTIHLPRCKTLSLRTTYDLAFLSFSADAHASWAPVNSGVSARLEATAPGFRATALGRFRPLEEDGGKMETRRRTPGFRCETATYYLGSTLSNTRFASNELNSINC
ncbi:hypothetical protein QZH47_21105 [Pseudomonas corrugata]